MSSAFYSAAVLNNLAGIRQDNLGSEGRGSSEPMDSDREGLSPSWKLHALRQVLR